MRRFFLVLPEYAVFFRIPDILPSVFFSGYSIIYLLKTVVPSSTPCFIGHGYWEGRNVSNSSLNMDSGLLLS
jgi:hypothetical protein